MFKNIFKKRKDDLATRCQTYLESGPPEHMTNYVPGSLTEIIITEGANRNKLDPELAEIASIILEEVESIQATEDDEIRDYLLRGSILETKFSIISNIFILLLYINYKVNCNNCNDETKISNNR